MSLLLQLAGVFAVLYGISYWSVPAALIVGGLGAVIAIERQTHAGPVEDPIVEQRIRAKIDAAMAKGFNPFDQQDVPMSAKWLTYVALVRRSNNAAK